MELSPNQFTFDTNRLFKVLDKTLAEVRTAQKNTSSISAADANPDGASKLTPEENSDHRRDTTLAQRPTIVRDLPRRPDTFGYAEAAPASLSKDMEPCWAGGRCPPVLYRITGNGDGEEVPPSSDDIQCSATAAGPAAAPSVRGDVCEADVVRRR